jgi:hypothetical protein
MALEYTLYLTTNLKPEQVLQLALKGIGVDPQIDQSDKLDVLLSTSAPGLTIYAYNTGAERRSFFRDELGVEPSINILFRLDKFNDTETQTIALLKATFEVLRNTLDDALLIFNGEVVWLVRSSGKLKLNNNLAIWSSNLPALNIGSYEMEDIPRL